jgi:hypothetical protein
MKVVVVAFEQCRGYAREAAIRPNEHHTPVLGEQTDENDSDEILTDHRPVVMPRSYFPRPWKARTRC